MINGIARFADGHATQFSSIDEFASAWAKPDTEVWLDFEHPSEADLRSLGEILALDGDAIEDCLHGEQRPRIDEFEDHIFIVIYGLLGPEGDELDPRKLAAFCGQRFLVTVHRDPLRTVRSVRDRCFRHPKQVLCHGLDFILYHIIDGMTDKYLQVTERYVHQIEQLEESSLNEDVDDSVLTVASELRREILQVRTLAASQRELLSPIAKGQYAYISDSLEQRFSHVRDHLSQVIESIDELREQLANVRDNYHTALATRTNAVMKTLTVFASIMLPLTFLAGLYGMNMPLWPSMESPASFWYVIASMVAIAGVLLLYFRKKRWF